MPLTPPAPDDPLEQVPAQPRAVSRRSMLLGGGMLLSGGLVAACSGSGSSSSAQPSAASASTASGLPSAGSSSRVPSVPASSGSTPPTSSPSTSAAPIAGEFSYWVALQNSDPKTKDAFIKYNKLAFNTKYPRIKMNVVYKDLNTIDQNISTALAAGRGPDLVETPGSSNAVTLASANDLLDLQPYADKFGWKSSLLPWALEAGIVNGKLASIPSAYETLMVYYNKSLFNAKGWKPPTNRAELEQLAGEMHAAGITPFAAGNADYPAATEWLATAFWNYAAGPQKVHDALTGKTPWTDPELVASIDLLKSYFDKGWFAGGTKAYFTNSFDKVYNQLATAKAGMYISGSWEFAALPDAFTKAHSEWDWAAIPALGDKVAAGMFPLSVGGTLSISAHSHNAEPTAQYLEWLISDVKNMWAQVAASGNDPLPVNFTKADVPSTIDPRILRSYLALQEADQASLVGYTTWTFFGGKADTYITSNIDKVLTGKLSSAAFSAGVDTAFKSDLSRGLIPTAPTTKA